MDRKNNIIYEAGIRRVKQRVIEKGEIPLGGQEAVKQYLKLYNLPTPLGKLDKYVVREYKNPESLIAKQTKGVKCFIKNLHKKHTPQAKKQQERKMEYVEFINSQKWKSFRAGIIKERGRKCEKCGETKGEIHAHHLTYERFMNELPEDIQLLCKACHMAVHNRRNNKKEKRKLANAQKVRKPKKQKKSNRPKWDKTPDPLAARRAAVRAKYAGISLPNL